MRMRNTPDGYGAVAQGLHWLTVLLVVAAWGLGVGNDALPRGAPRAAGLTAHLTLGLAVIVVTALRLGWRAFDPSPQPTYTRFGGWNFASLIGLGARLAHGGLYLLLVAVPVVGIVLQFARGGGLPLFGFGEIASPWPADRAFAHNVKEVHELLAHGLMALAGLHAAAALVHHIVFRDRTLAMMLPGRAR
jgi:cytochrome b561